MIRGTSSAGAMRSSTRRPGPAAASACSNESALESKCTREFSKKILSHAGRTCFSPSTYIAAQGVCFWQPPCPSIRWPTDPIGDRRKNKTAQAAVLSGRDSGRHDFWEVDRPLCQSELLSRIDLPAHVAPIGDSL